MSEREDTSRDCYCDLWQTNPKSLELQGVPRGFCGRCQTCGRPGHIRHFPGAAPFTSCWCDAHYRRLKLLHPMAPAGCVLWLAVASVVTAVSYFVFR